MLPENGLDLCRFQCFERLLSSHVWSGEESNKSIFWRDSQDFLSNTNKRRDSNLSSYPICGTQNPGSFSILSVVYHYNCIETADLAVINIFREKLTNKMRQSFAKGPFNRSSFGLLPIFCFSRLRGLPKKCQFKTKFIPFITDYRMFLS